MITAARLIVLGNVSRMRVVKQVSLTFFVIYSEVKNRANENVLFHLCKTEQEKITLCLILMIMKMIHAKIFEQFVHHSFLTNRQQTRAISVFGWQKLDNEENVLYFQY